uniref:Cytochrome P450 n=1 Tax=Acrobeloides nanus TaxID=290746 RepID=A0A914E3T3_9BILA
MNQLMGMLFDLWLAGQETTSNTLAWGVLYLMQEPEVQSRLQKELDTVIGSDRLITMDDRPKLNYTAAVVNEIQRIANLLALNVRHATSRDVNIKGYHIPEGTTIIPHISVILYDEKIFPNPKKFDPTRFLDKNGHLKKVEELIPFSVGKRQCLGEGLARMELFLFVANIFNQFKVNIISSKPPNMGRKAGATVSPQPFVCSMTKRY